MSKPAPATKMRALSLRESEVAYVKALIERRVMTEPNTGCWLWFCSGNCRYAVVKLPTRIKSMLAHRLSYAAWNGPIPKGLFILHRCDTPSCVNPGHLFLGTHETNVIDMCTKRRNAIGEKNGMAKLTADKVRAIRAEAHESCRTLAAKYGVSVSTISDIQIGRYWLSAAGGLTEPRLRGEARYNAKLTAQQAAAIKADTKRTQQRIADEFGVSRELVSRIKRGLGWKHVT